MRQHMKDYIENGTTGTARGVRIMAEYLRALEFFDALGEASLVTVFGSARLGEGTAGSALAEELGRRCVARGYGVVTGGSSGVMRAANKGAYEEAKQRKLPVSKFSIGCAITLPFETAGNEFLGTQTDFHYFFIRKFYLVAYSRAFFFVEGGGGTRDELWEVFCLIQTGRMPIHPLVAIGDDEAWRTVRADLDHMVARGTISPADRGILRFVSTPAEAVDIVDGFYSRVESIRYDKAEQEIAFALCQAPTDATLEKARRTFCDSVEGLRWCPKERALRGTWVGSRSYSVLYELVELLNADHGAGREDLGSAGA